MTGPRRVRIASAMALCALGTAVAVMPALHAQPLATPEQRDLAQARENAKWEQAIAARRLRAFLREESAPVRCQAFVGWSPRLYAVAASPDAEQHGVRRGDRIKVIGGESVTTLDDVKRIFSSVPAGVTSVDIVVGRALAGPPTKALPRSRFASLTPSAAGSTHRECTSPVGFSASPLGRSGRPSWLAGEGSEHYA